MQVKWNILGALASCTLAFSIATSAFAGLTPAQQGRIDQLEARPDFLDPLLANPATTPAYITQYFNALFRNPARVRQRLLDPQTPPAFARYLLRRLGEWAAANRYPNTDVDALEYAYIALSGFRELSPGSDFRDLAYRTFLWRVYPGLTVGDRGRLREVLTRYETQAETRIVAIPALILIDDTAQALPRIRRLVEEGDVEVLRRALEVIAIDDVYHKRADRRVQRELLPLLGHAHPRVVEGAVHALCDERHTLARRSRLPVGILRRLVERLDAETRAPNIAAILRVIGYNRENNAPPATRVPLEEFVVAAVRARLASQTRAVRIAALGALERMRPRDEVTLLALVAIVENGDAESSDDAALTLRGHRGDAIHDWIQSERVKAEILAALYRTLHAPAPDATARGARDQRAAQFVALLRTNPPHSISVFLQAIENYERTGQLSTKGKFMEVIVGCTGLRRTATDDSDQVLFGRTIALLVGATSESDNRVRDWLFQALTAQRLTTAQLTQMFEHETTVLRWVAGRLFEAMSRNRARDFLREESVETALAGVLEANDVEARVRVLRTIATHDLTPRSGALVTAITRNLSSQHAAIRGLASTILARMLAVRGRDQFLPLVDPRYRELVESLAGDARAAEVVGPLNTLCERVVRDLQDERTLFDSVEGGDKTDADTVTKDENDDPNDGSTGRRPRRRGRQRADDHTPSLFD